MATKTKILKTCNHCGSDFETSSTVKVYCRYACQQAAWTKRGKDQAEAVNILKEETKMAGFKPGDKVKCILPNGNKHLVEGGVYTIKQEIMRNGVAYVILQEKPLNIHFPSRFKLEVEAV